MVIRKPSGPPRPLNPSLVIHPQRGRTGPLRHSGRKVMTKQANGTAELIVLGRDGAGKPRAARFPAGHDNIVAKAAKAMNLTVCKADGEVVAELAKKLPPGRLYSTGRGVRASSRAKPLREDCRAVAARRSAGAGRSDQPNGEQSGTAQAAPGCRPAGTTLPSGTW